MPFLGSKFEHDVFVSYAHGRGGNLLRWSQRLTKELESNLLDLETEFDDFDIFIDPELDPTLPLTEQLRDKVQKSGLLMVIMTKRYLESDWCQKELDWFQGEAEACQKGGGLVLVVRAQPTRRDEWPTFLKDEDGHTLIGFTFHAKGRNGEAEVEPYGWPEPLAIDRPYYQELGKLTTIVKQRLREIGAKEKLKADADKPLAQNPLGEQPGIYFQASVDDAEIWRLTKQVMEVAKFNVFPNDLPVIDGDFKEIRKARKERLETIRDRANVVCFLGSRDAERLDREVEALANDQMFLESHGKDIPVVLLNRAESKPALAGEFGIHIINHDDEDWLDQVRALLGVPAETTP